MRSAPGFSELVFYAKRFVPSYVMWGTCISTASGPGMSNTSPQGYFIKRLHGLGVSSKFSWAVARRAVKVDAVFCLDNLETIGKAVYANILVAIVEMPDRSLAKVRHRRSFCTGDT